MKRHGNLFKDIVSSVMSYIGWVKHCNGYNLLKKHVLKNEQISKIMRETSERLEIENPLKGFKQKIRKGENVFK